MAESVSMGRRTLLKAVGLGTAGVFMCMPGIAAADEANAAGITYADTIPWTHAYDVVAVGFGGAGATVAITAADEGATVLILEKAPVGCEGGNTRYCGQNFGVIDAEQADLFKQYYRNMRGDFSTPSDELIDAWIDEFVNNESWFNSLVDSCEYRKASKLEEPEDAPEGLEEANRMLLGSAESTIDGVNYGRGLWNVLYHNVWKRRDLVDVWYNAPATELIQDPVSKAVIGVRTEKDGVEYLVRAYNGVVMTCGGYENSPRKMEDYACLTNVKPTGTLYNTGDGIDLCSAVGARIWHMANILGPGLSCCGLASSSNARFKNLFAGAPGGYMRVGPEGRRWHNEFYGSRHGRELVQGETMPQRTFDNMWHIFDEAVRTGGTLVSAEGLMVSENLEEEIAEGLVLKADTFEELAGLIGVPAENLVDEVSVYNGYAESGVDVQFGRPAEKMVPFAQTGPYYAWRCVRSVINSQGGAERGLNAAILDQSGNPIPHLYSAGEFGFVASLAYNGGHNTGDCAASGRIAGRNAAAPKDPLPPLTWKAVEAAEQLGTQDFGDDPYMTFENSEGVYYGTYAGMSMITAKVTMENGAIASIELPDFRETPYIGGVAAQVVPAAIVETQQIMVDAVAGATTTSKGIMGAVANALRADYPEYAAAYDEAKAAAKAATGKGASGKGAAAGADGE